MTASTRQRKNIILLIVDALSTRRMGYFGYDPSPTPRLDKMAENSLTYSSHFSVGCPTQFALPGIFTSTLPLDDGGYEYGIRYRDSSIAEIFHSNGYRTAGFVSGFGYSNLFGYDRGFDEYYTLYDFSLHLMNVKKIYIEYYRRLVENGVSLDACVAEFSDFVFSFLHELRRFCSEKMNVLKSQAVIESTFFEKWDFKSLAAVIDDEILRFETDRKHYTKLLLSGSDGFVSVIEDRYLSLGKKVHDKIWKNFTRGKNILRVLQSVVPTRGFLDGDLVRVLRQQNFRTVTASYVLDNMTRWLGSHNGGSFFLLGHLMDAHDGNYFSFDRKNSRHDIRRETSNFVDGYKEISKLASVGRYRGNIAYDLSLKYIDYQIGVFLERLAESGLLDDTAVVITGDHGMLPWQAFGNSRDFDKFEDELYHCPVIIIDPAVQSNCDNRLCSSIDLAPTLLDLVNMRIPDSFKGKSLLADRPPYSNDNVVFFEHLGRGPFDIKHKEARVTVRSEKGKIVTHKLLRHGDLKLTRAFNLESDPSEEKNLAGATGFSDEIEHLIRIARKRYNEIEARLNHSNSR